MQSADFVIIGSGSAGSALAYRLSEDGKNSVLVLEFGGSDFGPFIQMPAALAWPMSMSRYNWGYLSEPEPNLNNRRITAPRGKVIGGSSSINGMVYVRGSMPEDYRPLGRGSAREGWAYSDVAALFRPHGELARRRPWRRQRLARALGGPLHVTRAARYKQPALQGIRRGRTARPGSS